MSATPAVYVDGEVVCPNFCWKGSLTACSQLFLAVADHNNPVGQGCIIFTTLSIVNREPRDFFLFI